MASTPTPRMPWRRNSSSAAANIRSRGARSFDIARCSSSCLLDAHLTSMLLVSNIAMLPIGTTHKLLSELLLMRHNALRITSLAAAILTLAQGCAKPAPVASAPEVTVAPAVNRQVTDWDEFTGHFEAIHSVEVRPRVSGFIERVSFPEGATVSQGDVLLTIDPRPYEPYVARAAAPLDLSSHH